MSMRTTFALFSSIAITAMTVAQDPIRDEIRKIREDVEALKNRDGLAADSLISVDANEDSPADSSSKGGIFDKPFLEDGPTVNVGGYFDVEFRDERNQPHEFRFHRFIPFFYANLHDRIRFASELEIEDGSEVEIEFAFIDIDVIPQANFRGGVILDPLGKFNLIHDSPINDLTDRPLVNRFVIPTTLREVGVGLFGDLSPDEWDTEIKYEAYVTSGFKGLNNDGTTAFSTTSGVRSGRASSSSLGTKHFADNNNSFSGVGRVSVSPTIGSEFGLSAHSGDYDQMGHNNLTITAIDGLFTLPQMNVGDVPVGPIELQGEAAYAFVERDTLAAASGIPGDLWGYYLQMNYHFMPAWMTDNAPAIFFPGSTFTFVTRWGQIDLDGHKQTRLTFGLNYRPIESTVIKFDYQINRGFGTAPASADDDALVISIASFF